MIKTLLFAAVLSTHFIFSQTRAITSEGKEVVLFDNKTWKFVYESDNSVLESIQTNSTDFKKDTEAQTLVKSTKLDIGFYFQKEMWQISTPTNNPLLQYLFTDRRSQSSLAASMITEKLQIPGLKNLKDIILSSVQSRVDFFRLKESEYRTVNGLKVLYLRYIANSKGLDFEYAGYYYLDKTGYCGIVAFSLQNTFEKDFPMIQNFLNGLSYAKKDSVEYSSPPPPMK